MHKPKAGGDDGRTERHPYGGHHARAAHYLHGGSRQCWRNGLSADAVRALNVDKMPDAQKDDAIIVAVTRDGRLFRSRNPINLDQITSQVKDLISDRPDKIGVRLL